MTYTTKWLRVEALGVLLAVLAAYAVTGGSWLVFIGLLLAPDLAMVGYLLGPRAGAAAYNVAHLYIWPVMLLLAGAAGVAAWALPIGLIWAAHIAMDRSLGYGLKRPDGFQQTHLGRIGRAAAPPVEGQPASSSTTGA